MTPPNLLFLFTDEQRADTLAAYGNMLIQMPNLDRLAARATVFERAYVTQPVCTPSRASLLTGLWPHTSACTENNVPLPAGVPTLAEMLPPGRYATGYFGKWHLGDEVFAQHGFAEWRSIEDGYHAWYGPRRDPDTKSTYHEFLIKTGFQPKDGKRFGRGEAARLPEPFGKPAYLAGEASDFIRRHRGRPWCLFVNFLEPHMPFYGPRDGQYDPSRVTLPANFNPPPADDQPLKTRLFYRKYYERGHEGQRLQTEDDWRRLTARYWGLCSLVDTHVGTILRTLAECGLDDSTIIVYTSDHGDMMGSHRLLAKCVQFEEGQAAGRRVRGPVSHIDVAPTLLDVMGVAPPPRLQGKSLRPLLEGLPAAKKGSDPQTAKGSDAFLATAAEDVFIEWNGPNSGVGPDVVGKVTIAPDANAPWTPEEEASAVADPVRTLLTPDGWKFNCSPRGDHELYNLNDDPIEVKNLAFRPEMQPRLKELLARLRAWQRRVGDRVTLPEPPYTRKA
jgi:arylsulfatase A-like enzyme